MYIVGNEKTIKLFEKVVKQWSQNKDNNCPIGWKNGKPVYRNNMENEELKAVAINPIKVKEENGECIYYNESSLTESNCERIKSILNKKLTDNLNNDEKEIQS